jgi:hypothetical protein
MHRHVRTLEIVVNHFLASSNALRQKIVDPESFRCQQRETFLIRIEKADPEKMRRFEVGPDGNPWRPFQHFPHGGNGNAEAIGQLFQLPVSLFSLHSQECGKVTESSFGDFAEMTRML